MLDLNSFSEENEVSILNNGEAGKVENVKVRVQKKTPEDHENAPDFKIFYKDNTGEINDGIYYPSSTHSNPKFIVTRLLNVLYALDPSAKDKQLPKVKDFEEAINTVMKMINAASKTGTVNIFVNYGTKNRPSNYLTVRAIDFIEPVGKENSKLKALTSGKYADLMERPDASNEEEIKDEFESNDDDSDFFDL